MRRTADKKIIPGLIRRINTHLVHVKGEFELRPDAICPRDQEAIAKGYETAESSDAGVQLLNSLDQFIAGIDINTSLRIRELIVRDSGLETMGRDPRWRPRGMNNTCHTRMADSSQKGGF